MRIGFFLATEEFTPAELLAQARAAEEAGFHGLWISDHFHPWNDEQGQSPFVWTVLGALSQVTSSGPVTTAVTCPTLRQHPAGMAHASVGSVGECRPASTGGRSCGPVGRARSRPRRPVSGIDR
jgi:G6PDH family F420-dependent oxidoreductase